jgi:hypothetical protein
MSTSATASDSFRLLQPAARHRKIAPLLALRAGGLAMVVLRLVSRISLSLLSVSH